MQMAELFSAAIVVLLMLELYNGSISTGGFSAIITLLLSVVKPVKVVAMVPSKAVKAAGSVDRIKGLLRPLDPNQRSLMLARFGRRASTLWKIMRRKQAAHVLVQELSDAAAVPQDVPPSLRVQAVSFTYPLQPGATSASPAIANLSLTFGSEFTAIVGASGCGKSTLLSLLLTWYEPDAGVVALVGKGQPLRRREHLRTATSIVFQNTPLLEASVHANVALGVHPPPTREQVQWAAKAAACDDFICQLPDGYDTTVSASNVSGGQAQRLCIARALCRKPKVLLLDEATSALEETQGLQILTTIAQLRTMYCDDFADLVIVMVTHQQFALKVCYVVVHLGKGGGVEQVERRKACAASIDPSTPGEPSG